MFIWQMRRPEHKEMKWLVQDHKVYRWQLAFEPRPSGSASTAFSLVQCSPSVMSDSVIPGTAAHQASLSFTTSWSLFRFTFTEVVMPFKHLILCHTLTALQLSKYRPLLSPSFPNLLQNLSSSTVIWQLLHNALHYNFMWSSHLPNPSKVFIFWQQHNNFLETVPELGSETLDVKAVTWDFKWPQQALDTLPFCCGPRELSHLQRFL